MSRYFICALMSHYTTLIVSTSRPRCPVEVGSPSHFQPKIILRYKIDSHPLLTLYRSVLHHHPPPSLKGPSPLICVFQSLESHRLISLICSLLQRNHFKGESNYSYNRYYSCYCNCYGYYCKS